MLEKSKLLLNLWRLKVDNSELTTTREPKEPTPFENFSSRSSLYEVFIVKIREKSLLLPAGGREK